IVAPIIRLLRIVDADEKPSMGYVYDCMQRAKNAIKMMFRKKKNLYKPYTELIKARWDRHLKRNLHATTYFFNPAFFYDEDYNEKNRVVSALLDLLDKKDFCNDLAIGLKEMQVYRDRQGTFSRESAFKVAKQIRP
ncbi:Ribonuclease H-like superfamily, partial [Sesbania bispinosa]